MMREKGKEIYQNGTAFRSFANFDEPNIPRRQAMEDQSFVIDCFLDNAPKSALFGVYDGHGGFDVSRFLVKSLPQVLFYSKRSLKIPMENSKKEEKHSLNSLLSWQLNNYQGR